MTADDFPTRISQVGKIQDAAEESAQVLFGETRVVDSHHHFWDLSCDAHPWLQDPKEGSLEEVINHRYFTYGPEAYLRAVAPLPIAASVHVEASWNPSDPVAETRWLQGLRDSIGWPSAIVGAVQLDAPDALQKLRSHARFSAFRGVRGQMGWDATDSEFQAARTSHQMSDSAWLKGFSLLEPLGLSFDLHVYPSQLGEAAQLAATYPNTTIVLNHSASPDAVASDRKVWSEGLVRLAECQNVSVKLSGITAPARSTAAVVEYVSEVLDVFGCDRTMFGSNLPVEELEGSLNVLVDALRYALSECTPLERDAVWGGNAARIYRIEPLQELELNL
jgi:predicted TIM-barrel fold metal-dependent hydrolase